jgi:hypothetical protein
VAEGDAEVTQLLRRMTANAWRVGGGAIIVAGPQVWPVFWVAPDGQAALTAFSRFHQDPAGQPLPDFATRTAWDGSRAETTPGPRIARLTLWARHPAGEERALSLWWDAASHAVLLATVVRCRRMMVLAAKPAPAALRNLRDPALPPGVVVVFDHELVELTTLLGVPTSEAG